jgi:hypothetical protein
MNLDMEVIKYSNKIGDILVMGGGGIRFIVKLDEKTCSCREWQILGIPSVRIIAFITLFGNEPLDNYVDLFYSVQDFQAAYAQLILALKDMSQWPKYVAGRRKKQRFRCCIKNKNTTKKEKRTTFVPYIYAKVMTIIGMIARKVTLMILQPLCGWGNI